LNYAAAQKGNITSYNCQLIIFKLI